MKPGTSEASRCTADWLYCLRGSVRLDTQSAEESRFALIADGVPLGDSSDPTLLLMGLKNNKNNRFQLVVRVNALNFARIERAGHLRSIASVSRRREAVIALQHLSSVQWRSLVRSVDLRARAAGTPKKTAGFPCGKPAVAPTKAA